MSSIFTRTTLFFLLHSAVLLVIISIFYYSVQWCFAALHSMLTIFGFVLNVIALLVASSASAMMITLFIKRYSLAPQNYFWMIPVFSFPACLFLHYLFGISWDLIWLLFLPGLLLTAFFSFLTRKKEISSRK